MRRALLVLACLLGFGLLAASPATAQTPVPPSPTPGTTPAEEDSGPSLTLDVPGAEEPSDSVLIIILLTLLSVAPALLILLTSFTRIAIVLSLTRQALGR